MNPRRINLAAAAALAAAAFLVYLPALSNDFVNWDDPRFITHPGVQAFDIAWAFTSLDAANWVPLSLITHALDYRVWGLNAFGHHLTSVLLHSVNTALVFALSLMLAKRSAPAPEGFRRRAFAAAFVTSALFAIHPLHVESVAWVAERRDVLYAPFFLAAMMLYLKYAEAPPGKRAIRYILVYAAFVLSFMAKPMAVTLPAVLIVLDIYPLKRLQSLAGALKLVVEKLPFFALSAFLSAVAVVAQRGDSALIPLESMTVAERAAVAVRALGFYVYKTLWPSVLAPYYQRPEGLGLTHPEALAAIAFSAAVGIICIVLFRRARFLAAAWLFYAVTLLPVIGIVQVGAQAAADRYTYLPGLGLFMLAGCAAAAAYERGGSLRAVSGAAVIAVFIALAALTIRQQAVWKDAVTLWTYQIETYPDARFAKWIAHSNRGVVHLNLGAYQEAASDYGEAIKANPAYPRSYVQRARAYAGLGRPGEALADLAAALELDPENAEAYRVRGELFAATGEAVLAERDLAQADALSGRARGR